MKNYYHSKINQALKHIDNHIDEDIDILTLAKISGFSLYHFHRIFKSITGETPYESLLRLRLEKAVFLLKYRPELKVAEVAFETGFASIENFSRQFKSRFKLSPSAFRKNPDLQNSRIYQEAHPQDFYFRIDNSRQMDAPSFTVEIENLPEIPIAYIKAIFGTDGTELINRYHELMDWAQQNKINIKGEKTRFGMSIDNPEVTPASKYRYDFALAISGSYPLQPPIELGAIPAATYATVHVNGILENVAQAWDYLYKEWLPNSPYVPMHYPAIEEFIQGPEEIGWENFNLKCRIPIKNR